MITTLTPLAIVQRAYTEIMQAPIQLSGTVATNFGGSPQGTYAATLYQGALQLLLRQQDPEFARRVIALSLSGGSAPAQWTYEYVYPTDCVRIRQVFPATWDANDPQPVYWEEGYNSSLAQVVIWSDTVSAQMTYTTNAVSEGEFDDGFTEVLVRYLASQFAMPVAGRPDFSRESLETSGRLATSTVARDS